MKNSFLLLITLLLTGCNGIPKMKNYADGWVGAEYSSLLKAGELPNGNDYVNYWKNNNINKDYYLKNGNLVHVYPARKGCIIHWEVDKNTDNIISYKFEGDRCY